MSVTRTIYPKSLHKYQAIADLDQDPPVQNTWYTVLDETGGLRIKVMPVRQTNNEAAAKSIDVRMTIDGVSIDATVTSQGNGTWYYWSLGPGTERVIGAAAITMFHSILAIHCHDALIEIRMTSAPGTNQKLDGRVHYETLDRLPG